MCWGFGLTVGLDRALKEEQLSWAEELFHSAFWQFNSSSLKTGLILMSDQMILCLLGVNHLEFDKMQLGVFWSLCR